MAMRIARGTVFLTSLISPLGTRALSTPLKAKMRRIDVRATAPGVGLCVQARFSGRTAKEPAAMRKTSGRSFATVATAFNTTP